MKSTCSVDGCDRPVGGRGLCKKHYDQWYRTNPPELSGFPRKVCSVDGCEKTHVARGWCSMHWNRWRITGSLELTERPVSLCTVEGCGRKMLARGYCCTHYNRWKSHGMERLYAPMRNPDALCAIEGCERKARFRTWCIKHYHRWLAHGDPVKTLVTPKGEGQGYRWITVDGVEVQEHRHVMELHLGRKLLPGEVVHHKNRQIRDNRVENLQVMTRGEHSTLHGLERSKRSRVGVSN